jgi:hypothetical protein
MILWLLPLPTTANFILLDAVLRGWHAESVESSVLHAQGLKEMIDDSS